MSLKRAREKAQAAAALKADGIDTLQHRQKLKAASMLEASRAKTFRECAEEWFKAHSPVWKSDVHRANWRQQMADYVYPIIGDLLVSDIGRQEVVRVLMQQVGPKKNRQSLWIAKSETARRIRGRIENVLDAAAAIELRSTENPARLNQLRPLLPKGKPKVHHHEALPYEKAPAFYAKLRRERGVGARALGFTILIAARTNETLNARWSEIDFDAAHWTIPAERMKAGAVHRVPLTKNCDWRSEAGSGRRWHQAVRLRVSGLRKRQAPLEHDHAQVGRKARWREPDDA